MELIIAVQPDSGNLSLLRVALDELAKDAEVLLVDSTEAALSVIDKRLPDVVLVHTFMQPTEQDYLIAYIRALPNADHVQTIEIPQFCVPSDAHPPEASRFDARKDGLVDGADSLGCDPRSFGADVDAYLNAHRRKHSWFDVLKGAAVERADWLGRGPRSFAAYLNAHRRKRSWFGFRKGAAVERADWLGCDPRLFAADVVAYLARAREIKQGHQLRIEDRAMAPSDRRREERRAQVEVPWVLSVRLADRDQADLVNLSSRGALVRTSTRPDLWSLKYLDLDFRQQRHGLTFNLESGAEVHAAGRVIRCHVVPLENGPLLYEVAFRFDDSVCLDYLPAVSVPAGSIEHELSFVPGRAQAHHVY